MEDNGVSGGLLLKGLSGSNPLAFLAAVGVLRTVALARPQESWRMGWAEYRGGWSPVLSACKVIEANYLVDMLDQQLKKMKDHSALTFAQNTSKIPCGEFRETSLKAQSEACFTNHIYADFIVAFGCESTPISQKNPSIQDTALRMMSGSGHQHFVKFMKDLAEKTEASDLRTSLFQSWKYEDEGLSMRWDPQDDRRYALRWKNPSASDKDNKVKSMRGANRLAIEALPMFPTAPVKQKLETTGFSRRPSEGAKFSWPIWTTPVSSDSMRSILALGALQASELDRNQLEKRGVAEVYRSERITTGKFRNFTAAVSA